MKIVDTFTANIYIGFREEYSETVHTIDSIREYLETYCNDNGFAVTLTPTEFIYTSSQKSNFCNGEPGCIVGLINYPMYPMCNDKIESIAIKIAKDLLIRYGQFRVSIVMPAKTITIERSDCNG